MSFPDEKYEIIYADPPWQYADKANAGKRGASHKYSVMSLEDIMELPVNEIAADNCALFCWITAPMIGYVIPLCEKWGFNYKTIAFVWVKKNKKKDSPFWGMGNWTRANAEICFIAVKGKPERISKAVHQVAGTEEPEVSYTPVREHSRKPDEVRDRIIELCGDKKRIELFARDRFEGWDAWGDELEPESVEDLL